MARSSDKPSPIRAVIDGAREVPRPVPDERDAGRDVGGDRGGDDGPAPPGLPEGCPVVPLGTVGRKNYYLDACAHYVEMGPKDHGRNDISQLFHHRNGLLLTDAYWPRKTEVKVRDARGKVVKDAAGEPVMEWVVNGFAADKAADALIAACGAKGTWNPRERLRDVGAWAGEDGGLILHCGDVVWLAGAWLEPGVIGDNVYPAGEAVLRPPPEVAPRAQAQKLLDMLATWNWQRGALDARLLFGWICAALVCGALEWRPVAWITGDTSTGKSTLQRHLKALFGRLLLQSANSTAAAISQEVGQSTRPVAVDELEAEEDNRRAREVVELARLAASGARKTRGGADHKAVEFVLRSCFLFAAVLMPPMLPQDKNRQAILALDPLRAGQKAPEVTPAKMAQFGAVLLGRMARGWPRLPATLALYRDALLLRGHGARGADVFGTLLACADLALGDALPDSDTVAEWADRLLPGEMVETADAQHDHERMLSYLGSVALPRDGAALQRKSVAELALEASVPLTALPQGMDAATPDNAQRLLCRYGLKVVTAGYGAARAEWLFVANSHAELTKLFAETHWHDGVWTQALDRVPDNSKSSQWMAGAPYRGRLIPLAAIATRETKAAAKKAPAPAGADDEADED